MNVDVQAPPEVPVEQTQKTSPLTDIEKFRIIELPSRAGFLLSAIHRRELRRSSDLNDNQEAPEIVSHTPELFH
jgi:hypothetical protein